MGTTSAGSWLCDVTEVVVDSSDELDVVLVMVDGDIIIGDCLPSPPPITAGDDTPGEERGDEKLKDLLGGVDTVADVGVDVMSISLDCECVCVVCVGVMCDGDGGGFNSGAGVEGVCGNGDSSDTSG